MVWEEDHNHLARVLVKAKVVDLEDVPWFILFIEADDFEGKSWTFQCEILQTCMLVAALRMNTSHLKIQMMLTLSPLTSLVLD